MGIILKKIFQLCKSCWVEVEESFVLHIFIRLFHIKLFMSKYGEWQRYSYELMFWGKILIIIYMERENCNNF